jgi:multimeric flavodoxin WrbA
MRGDLVNYDAIVLSSPTYVHNLVSPMKSFLFKMEDMDLKEKSERRSVGGAVKPSR